MAATAEAKIETPAAARISPVNPARFFGAEYKRNVHLYNLPVGDSYEDLFKPETWRLVAQKGAVGIGDKIEVRRDDMSLFAELLVVEAVTHHARIRVVELLKKEFAPVNQDDLDDVQFEIKHLGLQDGWAVLSKSTGRVIRKDMKSKEDARYYMNNDLRTRAVGR